MSNVIFAAISDGITEAGAGGSLSASELSLETIISTGMSWLTWIVGVLSVIYIVLGGLRYITSGGDADKVKKAKNTVLYACIGLGVSILSFALANFVANTLGSGSIGGPA